MPTQPILSFTSEQFKATLEENTLIQNYKTTWCYQATSPSTSTTLEVPTTYIPSSCQVEKTSRKGGMRYSSQPWTQCSSIITEKGITTWRSPELQFTNKTGEHIRIRCSGSISELLRRRDWRSTRQGLTRSSFTTLPAACIEKVVVMNSEEVLHNKIHESSRSPREVESCAKTDLARRTKGYFKCGRETIRGLLL